MQNRSLCRSSAVSYSPHGAYIAMAHSAQTAYLGYWATLYDNHAASEVPVPRYVLSFLPLDYRPLSLHYNSLMGGYAIVICVGIAISSWRFVVSIRGNMRASRHVHESLMISVLGTTFRFLDMTPVGRLVSRLTTDVNVIDGSFAQHIRSVTDMSTGVHFQCLFASVSDCVC